MRLLMGAPDDIPLISHIEGYVMRHNGTIKKWNQERGFGFVEPEDGGQDVFAHILEFPNKSACPQVGENITFSIKTTPDGKERAVQIVRTSSTHSPQPQITRHRPLPIANKSSAFPFKATIIATLMVILMVAAFIYFHQAQEDIQSIPITQTATPEPMATQNPVVVEKTVAAPRPVVASEPVAAPKAEVALEPVAQRFSCDGRTHCRQMTSCDEAIFFIKNCPNTQMDGDHDGVPCEMQWCGNAP